MSDFSVARLKAFKQQLLELGQELKSLEQQREDAAEVVELDQTRVGRLSRMDALQAQAMAKESQRRQQLQLVEIAAALNRIESGDFGYCTECGEPVALARLEHNPSARYCIECAGKAEQG